MENVIEPTSLLINMHILDKDHAKEIYSQLLKKQNILSLTLKPLSYYDVHLVVYIKLTLIGD